MHVPKPLAPKPAHTPPQMNRLVPHHVRPEVPVLAPRIPAWQISSSTLNTTATGSTSCSRASSTSGARASACTLVASTTVNSPRASRFPTMYRNTSNASLVASKLFSSSLTNPRQKSDDTTSVDLKCLRANVDFPLPLVPISTTRHSSGIVSFVGLRSDVTF